MLGERYEILFYQKLVGAPSVLNTYLLYTMGLFEKGERIVIYSIKSEAVHLDQPIICQ